MYFCSNMCFFLLKHTNKCAVGQEKKNTSINFNTSYRTKMNTFRTLVCELLDKGIITNASF